MIFHPAILALLTGSILISAMLCYSAYYGVRILKRWDIKSGSELQLSLERRTYLISTMVTYAFGFQLISLFLFVYTADHLHTLFVGAMCAAGSLNVNKFGYPTIVLKVVTFLLAGLWLVLNFTDNRGYDYPLVKKKYLSLLLITPFIIVETILQAGYFLNLVPDIITSCCGALFSVTAEGVTSGVIALPMGPAQTGFYGAMALALGLGTLFYLKGKGAYLFSLSSAAAFVASILGIISFISLYIYELPTHHCPFDILQSQYHWVGYPIYAALLGGAVSGMGVGIIAPFRKTPSLKQAVPSIQRRLALTCLISYAVFMLIVGYEIIFSNLTMTF